MGSIDEKKGGKSRGIVPLMLAFRLVTARKYRETIAFDPFTLLFIL